MRSGWLSSPERARARTQYLVYGVVGIGLAYLGVALLALQFVREWLATNFSIPFAVSNLIGLGCVVAGIAILLIAYARLSTAHAKFEEASRREYQEAVDTAIGEVQGSGDLLGLMNANRKQMDAYDSLARSQASFSYRTSQIAMGVGLALIVSGVIIVILADKSSTKYAAAIITAVGGATGAYLSRTFLAVQRDAAVQMNFYFEQPLIQSYLLAAERLLEKVPENRKSEALETIITAALSRVTLDSEVLAVPAPAETQARPGLMMRFRRQQRKNSSEPQSPPKA
jgi:MFS family permease